MPTRQTAAARMELAHREAVEVVKAHDSPERLAKLEAMNNPNTRRPEALASFQAELIASLAGMVADLYQSKAAKKKTS